MNKPRITVYTSNFCGYCVASKRLLERFQIPYEEIDLSADPAQRMELVQRTGHRTVPIILLDDELVGGYTELMHLQQSGGLDDLKPSSDGS